MRCELADPGSTDEVARELAARLAERLRVRTEVRVLAPGSLPRQEVGKARRVWERHDERDPASA